jgi:hypothetical protein
MKLKNASDIFSIHKFLKFLCIFGSEKGGLGAALPDQLGFFNFIPKVGVFCAVSVNFSNSEL